MLAVSMQEGELVAWGPAYQVPFLMELLMELGTMVPRPSKPTQVVELGQSHLKRMYA